MKRISNILGGELGLIDYYNLGVGNIFGVTEGAAGEKENRKLILFKYADKQESTKWLANAIDKIKKYSRNSSFEEFSNGLFYLDRKQNQIVCFSSNNYIIVIIDDKTNTSKKELKKLVTLYTSLLTH